MERKAIADLLLPKEPKMDTDDPYEDPSEEQNDEHQTVPAIQTNNPPPTNPSHQTVDNVLESTYSPNRSVRLRNFVLHNKSFILGVFGGAIVSLMILFIVHASHQPEYVYSGTNFKDAIVSYISNRLDENLDEIYCEYNNYDRVALAVIVKPKANIYIQLNLVKWQHKVIVTEITPEEFTRLNHILYEETGEPIE